MSHRMKFRSKPRQKTNRYDLNAPNWSDVHTPAYLRPDFGLRPAPMPRIIINPKTGVVLLTDH